MTDILNFCDKGFYQEGGLAPIASLPPPLRASHLLGLEVADAARTWLGTPFQHQGRVKGVGCDCLGLLVGVAAELGLPQAQWDELEYGHYPDASHLKQRLQEVLILADEPAPGHIGLFRIDGEARHLGIFGDYKKGVLTLIHAYAPVRKVVEHRLSEEWQERLLRAYSLADGV